MSSMPLRPSRSSYSILASGRLHVSVVARKLVLSRPARDLVNVALGPAGAVWLSSIVPLEEALVVPA